MNTCFQLDMDARTATILRNNAWGFSFLIFALLFDIMYRSIVFREASWDLFLLIGISGLIPVVYPAQHKAAFLTWKFLAVMLISGVIAAVVAALLTIVGFSVNDTVVICDRIRENLRKIKRETLESIVNTSINETLSRTILTTTTALMVLAALYFVGGDVIKPFAFSLLVGFISGVYSTIFIASPVILLWEQRALKK